MIWQNHFGLFLIWLAILGVVYRITESRWLVALVVSFWPSRLFLSDLASAWYSPVLMPRINFGLIISMSARCGCIRWLLTHHPDHDINRASKSEMSSSSDRFLMYKSYCNFCSGFERVGVIG